MTEQPTALRLADELEQGNYNHEDVIQTAAELRLQHAEIERLRNDLAVYRGMVASVIVTAPAAADDLIATYEKGFKDGAARRKPLTKERIGQIIAQCQITLVDYCSDEKQTEFARSIEAAHGIKEKSNGN